MNILIIEDDQNKLKQLQSFIQKERPDAAVNVRRSYQSGLSEIVGGGHDLIILDVSMTTYDQSPTESGGRKRPFAGREILRHMSRKGIATPVVVVTQFPRFGEGDESMSLKELVAQLEQSAFSNYLGTIYYSAEEANWENKMREILKKF